MATSPVGGLTLSKELRALSERPGYLSSYDGGQRMRDLYQQESARFDAQRLCRFGQQCFFGFVKGVESLIERGEAPDIETTTTAYKWSWVTLVVAGSQRFTVDDSDGPVQGGPDHEATLRYLISRGAPLGLQDIAGYTALHHATITMSVPNMARILLEAGADPNVQDKYGSPALSGAALSRQLEAIDVLMEFGARLDISDADDFCIGQSYWNFGPEVAAVIHKWIRRREGKPAPLEENACDYCGKAAGNGIKLAFCSRCKLARYDSKDCQKNHWKYHKLSCRAPGTENTMTFKPYYDSRIGGGNVISLADATNKRMGVNTKTAKDILSDAAPKSDTQKPRKPIGPDDKEASRMIIKIQVPLGMIGDCFVYNKKRDFTCLLKKAENGANYDALVKIIREKGVGGMKAYFRAELKSKDELEIRVDDVLAQQAF